MSDKKELIFKEYSKKDSRIKVTDKVNGGLSSARNSGLEVIASPYVTFLDSDDYFELDTLEVAHNAMTENDVDFVAASFVSNKENDRIK